MRLLTLIIALTHIQSFAQVKQTTSNRFFAIASIGRSSFVIDIPASDFTSFESRVGAGLVKRLTNRLDLCSSLQLGLKFKRKSYLNGQLYSQPGIPLLSINEVASGRNHWFFELPLAVQYNLKHPRVSFCGGLFGRSWFPNNKSVDVLTARQEMGVLFGIGYSAFGRIDTYLNIYEGLTAISSGSIYTNGGWFSYTVRNRSFQISIAYPFERK